jgi:hypothetical protein
MFIECSEGGGTASSFWASTAYRNKIDDAMYVRRLPAMRMATDELFLTSCAFATEIFIIPMTNANNNMSVVALERRSLPKNAIVQNQKVFCYFRLCVFLLSPPPPAGHAAHSKENKTSRVKVWTTCDVIFIFAYVRSFEGNAIESEV